MAATAWHWVIDALAGLEQTDVAYLRALIDKVPNFWTEAPQSVRVRVGLKYLEERCSGGAAEAPTSVSCPAIDEARSSEDACRSLLEKVAASGNIGKGGPELSSHDLHQFVLRKRSAIPKPCLDLLKDSILEGQCEAILSLKEFSGLSIPGQAGYLQFNGIGEHECVKKHTVSTRAGETSSQLQASVTLASDSGNLIGEHESVKKLKVNTADGEAHSELQASVTLTPNSDNLILQKGPPEFEGHLPKQNLAVAGKINDPQRNAVASKGSGVQLLHGSMHQPPGEKSTGCIDIGIKFSGSRHQCTEMNVSNFKGESIAQLFTRSSIPLSSHKGNTSLQHAPFSARGKSVNQPLSGADLFDGELSGGSETPSGSGFSDDLPSNFDPNDDLLTAEKHQLLSSQVHDHDSAEGYWSQQDFCIKCDKGGELLSCSTKGCLIVVHENCVGPLPDYKGTNLFYCPFCLFSRANYAYHKARRNLSRARKTLSTFVGKDLVRGQNKKLRFANIPRETRQAGLSENKNHQQSSHSYEQHREKFNDNLLEAKEQERETKSANLIRHAKDSLYVDMCNVSHDVDEIDNDEMVNSRQGVTKAQHCLDNAANAVNDGKLPCDLKMASSIRENTELDINREGEVGNGCNCNAAEHQQPAHLHATTNDDNLLHEEVDKYEISRHDVSRAKEKDEATWFNPHLEKFKYQEKIRTACEYDADQEASTSDAKRRNTAVTGNIHHEETGKNQKREKPSSGSTNKLIDLKNQEQISTTPNHDIDCEAADPQPSEGCGKRRRGEYDADQEASTSDAKRRNTSVTGKIHHGETGKNQKREKPSSGSTNKLIDLKNQEQISTTPNHDIDCEAADPQPSEGCGKRRRGDAAIGKSHHRKETVANPKSEKSSSDHSKRRVGHPKNHSHLGVSLGRRQRLLWTHEEEETLKDAVKKLSVDGDKNLPWKMIYDYGQHVFQNRNPGDLKDKWRNIMKREVKEEI